MLIRSGLGAGPLEGKFVQLNKERREAENEYEVGETMSDETYLLQRIMGLETELSYLAESSRQQQFRHNTELSRFQNDNQKLQARLGVLQAENNTLRQNENRGLQARLGVSKPKIILCDKTRIEGCKLGSAFSKPKIILCEFSLRLVYR